MLSHQGSFAKMTQGTAPFVTSGELNSNQSRLLPPKTPIY
jgi:hypothetical protein